MAINDSATNSGTSYPSYSEKGKPAMEIPAGIQASHAGIDLICQNFEVLVKRLDPVIGGDKIHDVPSVAASKAYSSPLGGQIQEINNRLNEIAFRLSDLIGSLEI